MLQLNKWCSPLDDGQALTSRTRGHRRDMYYSYYFYCWNDFDYLSEKKPRASEDAELGEDNINYRDSPHILHGNPNYKQAPHAPKTIHLAPPQPILLRPLPYYRPIAPQKCFPTLSRKRPSKIEILLLHTKYYAPFWWKKTNLATKFIQQPPPTRAWGSVQSA